MPSLITVEGQYIGLQCIINSLEVALAQLQQEFAIRLIRKSVFVDSRGLSCIKVQVGKMKLTGFDIRDPSLVRLVSFGPGVQEELLGSFRRDHHVKSAHGMAFGEDTNEK